MWGLETLQRLNDEAAATQVAKMLAQTKVVNALRKKSPKQFRKLVGLAKQGSNSQRSFDA